MLTKTQATSKRARVFALLTKYQNILKTKGDTIDINAGTHVRHGRHVFSGKYQRLVNACQREIKRLDAII